MGVVRKGTGDCGEFGRRVRQDCPLIGKKNEKKHEVRTDCFAYEVRPIRAEAAGLDARH